jgi:hypothetical protein
MSLSLPDRPNLEQLRKQAKELLKGHKHGDASACRILRHLGRFAASSDEDVLKAKVVLSEAQHALAKEYGFKNWAALVRCVRKGPSPGQQWTYHATPLVANVMKSWLSPALLREGSGGRCQLCDKPATIHVTDKSEGKLVEQHYCAKHAEENVLVQGAFRSLLYPAKYTVTVSVTQDQLDRQEAVPVTLPDGSVVPIRFPRDAMDGLTMRDGPKPGAAEKYCVNFLLKIIPPPAQR